MPVKIKYLQKHKELKKKKYVMQISNRVQDELYTGDYLGF